MITFPHSFYCPNVYVIALRSPLPVSFAVDTRVCCLPCYALRCLTPPACLPRVRCYGDVTYWCFPPEQSVALYLHDLLFRRGHAMRGNRRLVPGIIRFGPAFPSPFHRQCIPQRSARTCTDVGCCVSPPCLLGFCILTASCAPACFTCQPLTGVRHPHFVLLRLFRFTDYRMTAVPHGRTSSGFTPLPPLYMGGCVPLFVWCRLLVCCRSLCNTAVPVQLIPCVCVTLPSFLSHSVTLIDPTIATVTGP